MMPDLATRKPITALTLLDLDTFPVWEYAMGEEGIPGKDETWVRPLDRRSIPARDYSLQVATRFQAANGLSFQGFSIVTTACRPVEITGWIVLAVGAYLAIDELPDHMGIAEEALFPVTFKL